MIQVENKTKNRKIIFVYTSFIFFTIDLSNYRKNVVYRGKRKPLANS